MKTYEKNRKIIIIKTNSDVRNVNGINDNIIYTVHIGRLSIIYVLT